MKRKDYTLFNLLCLFLIVFFGVGTYYVWQNGEPIDYTKQVADVPTIAYQDSTLASKHLNTSTPNQVGTLDIDQPNEINTDKSSLPTEINLEVPFTSQAPEKNWDQPWQDACEEAAVLMLDAYYNNYGLSVLSAKDEILKMVNWQEELGWGRSIPIEKVEKLVEEFKTQDLRFKIITNPTVQEIKRYIASGHPVLAVASGKKLPNPHFRNDGPEYHALIIRGYTEDSFITNDPGTQFGKNFQYKYNDLINAIHDWNDGDVESGQRVILVAE